MPRLLTRAAVAAAFLAVAAYVAVLLMVIDTLRRYGFTWRRPFGDAPAAA